MHPELARRFNPGVLEEAASRYGLEAPAVRPLVAFENFVFDGATADGDELILRIAHSTRRSLDYTLGEIEFVRYLAAAGLPVAQPVLAESGRFVESIEDGEAGQYFVVTAFERAPGYVFDDVPPLKAAYWKPELFRELGRIFARMHLRAEDYRPGNPRCKRQEWREYDVVDIDRFAPADERLVRERTAKLIERLERLPRSGRDYGLIHADLHPHNFCFDAGKITVFDFDNCEYAWFVKDIAVIVFYVARAEPPERRDEAAAAFLGPFLAGYRELRECTREWLAAVPDLLALQRAMNYALFHQYRPPGQPNEATLDSWRRFRRDIEGDVPVLRLDFERF